MRKFVITAEDLNNWFAAQSPDCLNDPQFGRGDLRRCSAGFFASHARSAWGLRQIGYPGDGFGFLIVDEEQFFGDGAASGMSRHGVVEEADE